jgi:hypothetical protein
MADITFNLNKTTVVHAADSASRLNTVFTRIKENPAYKMTPLYKPQFSGKYQYSH